MTINEKFKQIIALLYGGNKRSFANTVGVSPTVIENVVGTRQGKPSFDVLEKVCANANINPTWLLTGEGDMLRPSAVGEPEPREAMPLATTPAPQPQFESLIATIREQAEEIGRLKARIDMLERRPDAAPIG